jgi:hypothetical protein
MYPVVTQRPKMNNLLQDLRFAFRQIHHSPGFAFTAVLTLALAIGANAVVFAILNSLILRPLDVPQAQSLYGILPRLPRSPRSQPQLRGFGRL